MKECTVDISQIVLDQATSPIFWKDLNLRYIGCNKLFLEMVGKEPQDIIGHLDKDVFKESKYFEKYLSEDKEVLKTKSKLIFEAEINTIEGPIIALVSKDVLLDKNKNVIGLVGVYHNITLLKNTEKSLKKASEAREKTLDRLFKFVSDQEHDIRTPLGGLVSGTALVSSLVKSSPDEAINMLAKIHESAREILDYQESLLYDLYQGEREGRTIFTRFDISDIAHRIFKVNETSLHMKQINYKYSFDQSIPKFLIGDGKVLYQCLLDLMGNAVKFTSNGEISLDIRCLEILDNEAIVRFTITDTGIGIPHDKQQDILEAFVKIKPSNQGGERGRGLGLTRVSRYAKNLDGELYFKSEPGKGSSFKLVLPFKISLDQENIP